MAKTQYRVRFVVDEDASFEECNGEARPLTEAEYLGNEYRACPEHLRSGSKVIAPARKGKGGHAPIVGCATCARPGDLYVDIPYQEYLAYYGNPERHVYLGAELQASCSCCEQWRTVESLWNISLMDDCPEYLYVNLGRWYPVPIVDTGDVRGYLVEIARELYDEARPRRARRAANATS